MAGTMSRADLLAFYKASLMDAAKAFTAADDADFNRHLDTAAADMHRVRPITLLGEVTLIAEQGEYAAPADMARFKSAIWGVRKAMPWEKSYPGLLPNAKKIDGPAGALLSLSPAPSAFQIAVLGSAYRFYYVGRHSIGATAAETTIDLDDRPLLIMRAQAEAMNELAMRDTMRPVQIGGGHGGIAKTGMPTALWEKLMTAWLMSAQ